MMSLGAIQEANREAAMQAAEEGREPVLLYPGDFDLPEPPRVPHTGYIPNGTGKLQIICRMFVDISGFGGDGRSLDQGDMLELMESVTRAAPDGVYWALVEVGQFQGHVEGFVYPGEWFDCTEQLDGHEGIRAWALEPGDNLS